MIASSAIDDNRFSLDDRRPYRLLSISICANMVDVKLVATIAASSCPPLLQGPLDQQEADRLARALKTIADPARLRLLSLIQAQPGRRGVRLPPHRAARPQPTDCQPPPQGPPRRRPGRARAPRQLGLLPSRARDARHAPRHPRLTLCGGRARRSSWNGCGAGAVDQALTDPGSEAAGRFEPPPRARGCRLSRSAASGSWTRSGASSGEGLMARKGHPAEVRRRAWDWPKRARDSLVRCVRS